eukprot:scaffold118448_cov33-Tisochrysis_lutea.AAC.2
MCEKRDCFGRGCGHAQATQCRLELADRHCPGAIAICSCKRLVNRRRHVSGFLGPWSVRAVSALLILGRLCRRGGGIFRLYNG